MRRTYRFATWGHVSMLRDTNLSLKLLSSQSSERKGLYQLTVGCGLANLWFQYHILLMVRSCRVDLDIHPLHIGSSRTFELMDTCTRKVILSASFNELVTVNLLIPGKSPPPEFVDTPLTKVEELAYMDDCSWKTCRFTKVQ